MLTPIFKWMGGKRRFMPLYASVLDVEWSKVTHFYDLFAGSLAASMWAYENTSAQIHINEFNPFLIGLYRCIRDDTEAFIEALYKEVDHFLSLPVERHWDIKGHRHLRVRYHWYRQSLEDLHQRYLNVGDDTKFYALQYLLQRVSYGGAWQTNKRLNPTYATPSGSLTATGKSLYNAVQLREFARFLQDPRVTLSCGDYKAVSVQPGSDVVVFADPPYINTVQKYDAPFSVADQRELCQYLRSYADQKNKVMMTNAPWDQWHVLLPEFDVWAKDHRYTAGQEVKDTQELMLSNFLK